MTAADEVAMRQEAGRTSPRTGERGFGTMAGRSAVASAVAHAKLARLAEGARLASVELW